MTKRGSEGGKYNDNGPLRKKAKMWAKTFLGVEEKWGESKKKNYWEFFFGGGGGGGDLGGNWEGLWGGGSWRRGKRAHG